MPDSSRMPGDWIDLHIHILPAIDDGAPDMERALEMAEIAWGDGVGCLVATPHNVTWPHSDQRPVIRQATDELNRTLREAGIPCTVVPGVEAAIDPDIPEHVRIGRAFVLGDSHYLLLELPIGAYPLYTDQVIFELQVMGLSIVLAHPERNVEIIAHPEMLAPLVERGVLVQLTAGSIVGAFGPKVQRTAHRLMRGQMAHVIASDAHGGRRRTPILSHAVEAAAEIVGPDRARAMVSDTPRAILSGERIMVDPPELAEPEHRWRFWERFSSNR